jgi:hypothetical protein
MGKADKRAEPFPAKDHGSARLLALPIKQMVPIDSTGKSFSPFGSLAPPS